MRYHSLLAIAIGSILGAALPQAYADNDVPSAATSQDNRSSQDSRDRANDQRDIKDDQRDIKRDQADIRADQRDRANDQRDIKRDRSDIRADEKDLQQDRADVRADRQDLRRDDNNSATRGSMSRGSRGAALPQGSAVHQGLADNNTDRSADQRDIKRDQADIRADQKDLQRDRADLKADRQDLRTDRVDVRNDRRDLRSDRDDLRVDNNIGNHAAGQQTAGENLQSRPRAQTVVDERNEVRDMHAASAQRSDTIGTNGRHPGMTAAEVAKNNAGTNGKPPTPQHTHAWYHIWW